jgi:predicted negative regulator of RcsB-dependent stress response
MAKSKVSLARKKELNEPDEFMSLSGRFLQFVLENKIQMMSGAGVLFALVIIFIGFHYHSLQNENKASALLESAMIKYQSLVKDMGPAKAFEDIKNDFNAIQEKYSRTVAGEFAQVNMANIYYDSGNYEKAAAQYEKALIIFEDDPTFKNIILNGLGCSYEALNKNDLAIKYFEMIVLGPSNIMKGDALFNLGRIYALMEENTKSIDSFKQLISDHEDCIYIELAKERVHG